MSERHQDHELNEALRKIERQNDKLEHGLEHIEHRLDRIEREIRPHPQRTSTAAIAFGGVMNPGIQAVGNTLTATFNPIEADGVTVTPGSVLTVQPTWTSSDPTIATATANADGTAAVLGVAAGTVTITASQGSFTDADGTVVGPLDASAQDTVSGPSTGRTVSASITFA